MGELTGMAALVATLGQIFTQMITNISSLATAITASGNEILLLPVAFVFAGFFIGAFRRLIQLW